MVGWTGKLVSKVGHFLSPPLHGYLQNGDIQGDLDGFTHFSSKTTGQTSGQCASDTSSLTTFLLSVLSSSNAKYPRCNAGPEAPEEVPYRTIIEASDEHCVEHEENLDFRMYLQTSRYSFEMDASNMITEDDNLKNGSTPSLTKLPHLSEESMLLSESLRGQICTVLPTIVRDTHWSLIYSTARHGISMRTLYQRSSAFAEPFLLVVGDFEGTTFGGLVTAPLKPTAEKKYKGTNDTFVFTNLQNKPQIFRATGANRYYLLCTHDTISLGGGGHFAIRLHDTLLSGSSGPSATFGNNCLATSLEFSISNVEVWGFAHSTKQI